MGMNHKKGAMVIRGDMSRNNVDFMLLKNITKRGEQTRLLDGADTKMGMVAANIQDEVGGQPSLEGGGWRRENTNNIVACSGDGGKLRK